MGKGRTTVYNNNNTREWRTPGMADPNLVDSEGALPILKIDFCGRIGNRPQHWKGIKPG